MMTEKRRVILGCIVLVGIVEGRLASETFMNVI